MKLALATLLSVFFLSGCTVYTEKQSEAVSQNVYAANDSIAKARIDLAQFYSNEVTRFIKPPKNPINIEAVYQKDKDSKSTQRLVIIPEQYRSDSVVVVGSEKYNDLLKDSETRKQLERDSANKELQIKKNNDELINQKQMADKMVKDLNILQKKLVQKDLAILWRDIIIVVLLALIGVFVYIKVSRPGLI